MSHTDTTTPAFETKARPVFVEPDWTANHRAAQAAGNLAYSLLQHAGDTAGECAEAYHVAYVDTMRALGTPAACCCDYCHPEQAQDRAMVVRLTERGWSAKLA